MCTELIRSLIHKSWYIYIGQYEKITGKFWVTETTEAKPLAFVNTVFNKIL